MTPLLALLAVAATQAQTPPPVAEPAPMQCDVGPLHRTFGGNGWVVYSCVDGVTLVVAAGEGNPAQPFYFILYLRDGGYQLYGEGNGSQQASAAAMAELRVLTPAAIAALIGETRSAP